MRRFVAQSVAVVRPVRTRGRAGQDRGRSARADTPAANTQRSAAALDHLERAVTELRRDRVALRRLLRRSQRRHDRARAQAAVPDRRRRRRHLVMDPPRRRAPRRPFSRWNTRARRSTTSSTTIPPRCGSGCRCSPRPWARSRRGASRSGSRGCSPARSWSCSRTEARGASNAKAKRELGWTPQLLRAGARIPGGLLGNQRGRPTYVAPCHPDRPVARRTVVRRCLVHPGLLGSRGGRRCAVRRTVVGVAWPGRRSFDAHRTEPVPPGWVGTRRRDGRCRRGSLVINQCQCVVAQRVLVAGQVRCECTEGDRYGFPLSAVVDEGESEKRAERIVERI